MINNKRRTTMQYKIALPVNGVLVTLIAQVEITDKAMLIKSLIQPTPVNLLSVDRISLLSSPSFNQMAIEQIENQLLASELEREIYQ